MDDDLYDEFGNYIGPDIDDIDDDDDLDNDFADNNENNGQTGEYDNSDNNMQLSNDYSNESRIILHEDKKYYPDAEEIYPGVKTITLEEDAQKLSDPIIKPIKVKNFSSTPLDKSEVLPEFTYTSEFIATLMNTPTLIRNIAVVGHIHHGKTLFCDQLVQSALDKDLDPSKELRFTDTRLDEQERLLSIKSSCVSLILQNLKSKSYLFNVIDCPGHVNFSDESTAAFRVVDGAVIVVDAIEGVMFNTDRLIKHAVESFLPICLVISKMDRLILELKLPPNDAYYKLQHTLDEVNKLIALYTPLKSTPQRISPEKGNVCFASGLHGWSFTLLSFSEIYNSKYNNINNEEFSKRLWGDWYHNDKTGVFTKTKPNNSAIRTFIQYILEPLYKIYSQVISLEPVQLQKVMKNLNVILRNKEIHMDPKPLLRLCLTRYFGEPKGFVDMIVKSIPSPIDGNKVKIDNYYTGYQSSDIANDMRNCLSTLSTPLMANVIKLFNSFDGSKFFALTRIYSGTLEKGQKIRVLGEGFSIDDDEDMTTTEISHIYVGIGRHCLEINRAIAGNLVLLEGIDGTIKKTATITDIELEDIAIFKPLHYNNKSVFKIAIEPLNPSELPKMIESLRKVNKSYPLLTTKVEESGEHVVIGTGELYMDCVMHDIRSLYSEIEVKVSDPVCIFNETVIETSSIKCFAETANKKNKMAMTAEPLDKGLANDIETGVIVLDNNNKKAVSEFFVNKYNWDLLSSRSIWAFGANSDDPNVLLDDTLPSEVNKSLLFNIKESIIQGFRWGCREGPLCDEPMRNVKYKILDATIANEPIYRGGGQIIPTARRSIYSSFLLATPRLMEPVYAIEIQCPADCVQAVYPVLARRRGHVVQDMPKPGAPFYTVKAFIPVIDSVGFETDLRIYTQGQVFCQQVFDHWSVVTGDPLDRDIILNPLEPSPPLALARDFMIKTRRRKGLTEDVSVMKYFDDPTLLELAKQQENMM